MDGDLRYELLAVDLDGTLLDGGGKLPERNRAALQRAHEAGMRIVLCTGRSFTETRPVLDALGLDLDAAVTLGGALVSEARTGRTLLATPFAHALACEIAQWLLDEGNTVLWVHDPTEAGFDGYAIRGRRRHPAVDIWIERTPCVIRETDAPPDGAHRALRLTVVDDWEPLRGIAQGVSERFDGRVTFNVIEVRSLKFTVIETFAAPVSKWYGIRALCERWGVDPRRTAAIGDDVNDLPMVRGAGLGMAVANAVDEVREAADVCVARHDDCGVAEAVERVLAARRGGP